MLLHSPQPARDEGGPPANVSWDGRAARRGATSGHKRALATALDDPLVAEIVKSRSSDQAVAVELHDDNALVIYTDGSCLQKPRRGGYAYRVVTIDSAGDEVTVDYSGPGFVGATNNEMELWACVEALKHLAGRRPTGPSGRRSLSTPIRCTSTKACRELRPSGRGLAG